MKWVVGVWILAISDPESRWAPSAGRRRPSKLQPVDRPSTPHPNTTNHPSHERSALKTPAPGRAGRHAYPAWVAWASLPTLGSGVGVIA